MLFSSRPMACYRLSALLFVLSCCLVILQFPCNAFQIDTKCSRRSRTFLRESGSASQYEYQYDRTPLPTKRKLLYPRLGDIVRYYDLDGGKEDGQVLVGKISFIQKELGQNKWIAELAELEDVGDGYFAEYSTWQRQAKKVLREMEKVSPISASFVRSENAYKVPRETGTLLPVVRTEKYDLEGYEGPQTGVAIDQTAIDAGNELYDALKSDLFRNAVVAAVAGILLVDLIRGVEDAILFATGALGGLFYLFFLSLKTDTLASKDAKLGKNIANVRFLAPIVVLAAIALYNNSLGPDNPVSGKGLFTFVTPEQFGASIIGFFTYRIPFLYYQLSELIREDAATFPGSAAIVLAQKEVDEKLEANNPDPLAQLTPILVVSGPTIAGRKKLVKRLIAESNGRFVAPNFSRVSRAPGGADDPSFLMLDETEEYGLTKESLLSSGTKDESVVVVDISADIVNNLRSVGGARLIGVWVSLGNMGVLRTRIEEQLASGEMEIEDGKSKDEVIMSEIRATAGDIEVGLGSGIFEFTILNEDEDASMKELRDAAEYCFK